MVDFTIDNLKDFASKYGAERTKHILEAVAKDSPLSEALRTEIGKEILNVALKNLLTIQDKIVNETVSPTELAEYRVLKKILGDWSTRINRYYTNLGQIKRE